MSAELLLAAPALAAFAILLVVAAGSDIATMEIPDWVSIVSALLFLPAAFAAGLPLSEIGLHLLVGAGAFALGVGLFAIGAMGGGDVKVISAASVWTGFAALGVFALWTAIAGGVLAAIMLIARKLAKPADSHPAFLNRLLDPARGVPYAVAIAVGGLASLSVLPVTRAIF